MQPKHTQYQDNALQVVTSQPLAKEQATSRERDSIHTERGLLADDPDHAPKVAFKDDAFTKVALAVRLKHQRTISQIDQRKTLQDESSYELSEQPEQPEFEDFNFDDLEKRRTSLFPVVGKKLLGAYFASQVSKEILQREIEAPPTSRTLEMDFAQDPLSGISFLGQLSKTEAINRLVETPFDFSQVVQCLPSPYVTGQYITVQKVVLNTWHYQSNFASKNRLEDYICADGHKLVFKAFDGICLHCEGPSKELWVCVQEDQAHQTYCAECMSGYYTKMKLKEKSSNHSKWQPLNLIAQTQKADSSEVQFTISDQASDQSKDAVDKEIIAVIGLWTHSADTGITCWRQFFVQEPVFFAQDHCKGHQPWEHVFLHLNENKKDLQFFQNTKDNQLSISTVNLEAMMEQSTQQFVAKVEYGKDLWQLPVMSKTVLPPTLSLGMTQNFKIKPVTGGKQMPGQPEPNVATEYQCLPRIIDSVLVIQRQYKFTRDKKKDLKERINRLIDSACTEAPEKTSLYVCCTTVDVPKLVLEEGVLVISVIYKNDAASSIWVLESDYTIKKYQFACDPVLEGSFEIKDKNARLFVKGLLQKSGLQGFIHDKEQRCTILSFAAKKFITFALTNSKAEPLFNFNMNNISSLSVWQPSQDSLNIVVGLVKCYDDSVEAEGYKMYGLDIYNMNEAYENQVLDIKHVAVKMPTDIISTAKINANHIYPMVFRPMKHDKSQYMLYAFVFYADAVSKQSTCVFVTGTTQSMQDPQLNIKHDFQSQPILRQINFVEYPLLCYNTFHPLQNKLMVTNCAQNVTTQRYDLGDNQLVQFCEASFSQAFNCGKKGVICVLVRHKKQKQIQLMQFTLTKFPIPKSYQNYKEQKEDSVVLFTNRPVLPATPLNVMKAVKLEDRSNGMRHQFLVIQQLDNLSIFSLKQSINDPIQTDLAVQMSPQQLLVGPNQSFYMLAQYKSGVNAVVKFYLQQIPADTGVCTLKSEIVFEQKAQILQFQLDQNVDSVIDHDLLLYDIEGKIKRMGFTEVKRKIVRSENVDTWKQIQDWQRQRLSYLEDCQWRSVVIDERCIMAPNDENTKNTKGLLLNLNSSVYLPFTESNFSNDILNFGQKEKRRKKREERLSVERYLFMQPISHIRKMIGVILCGSDIRFVTAHSMGTRRIDLVDKKTALFCKANYIVGNEIYVKLKEDQVLIFNQCNKMLDRVEHCRSIYVLTRMYNNCQFVSRDEQMLYRYHANGNIDHLRSDFVTVVRKAQELVDPVLNTFGFISEVSQNFPTLDLNGDINILMFIKRQSSHQSSSTLFDTEKVLSKFEENKKAVLAKLDMKKQMCKRMADKIESMLKGKTLTENDADVVNKVRMLKIEIQQNSHDKMYDFVSPYYRKNSALSDSMAKNRCFVYICFTINEQLIPDMHDHNSFIFTARYLCWRAKSRVHFIDQVLLQAVNTAYDDLNLAQRLEVADCGLVRFDSIVLEEKYPDRFAEDIRINELHSNNLEIIVRDKLRRNCIQITLNELYLCWDLDENEEIDFLDKPAQINPDTYVRTGYVHFVEDVRRFRKPIGYDVHRLLFAVHADYDRLILFQLSSALDIFTLRSLEASTDLGLYVKDLDPYLLIANLQGRTFFSLFYDRHDLLHLAYQQIQNNFDRDSILIRQVYYLLKLPMLQLGRAGEATSVIAKLYNLVPYETVADANPRDNNTTISEYALHNDELLTTIIIKFFCLTDVYKTRDIISTFEDWRRFYGIVQIDQPAFFQHANVRTDQCKRVTALLSGDEDMLVFGGNSTQFSDKYIKQKLEKQNKCHSTEHLTLSPFSVFIIELEWLIGHFKEFYIEISAMRDDSIFDDKIVKFILKELDFSATVYIQFFIPELVLTALTIYYFTYILVMEGRPQCLTFTDGPDYLRFIILILDLYKIFVLIYNVVYMISKRRHQQIQLSYNSIKANIYFFSGVFLTVSVSVVNQSIIWQHCFGDREQSSLVTTASIMTLIMFANNVYLKMNLFEATAVYMRMINSSIYDIRYFALMFLIVICAFGCALVQLQSIQMFQPGFDFDDYYTLVPFATGNMAVDSLIAQYFVGLGTFDTSMYSLSPQKNYCWAYLLLGTFFTQILFLNMIINIMGDTFSRVTATQERSGLKAKTDYLAAFVYLVRLQKNHLSKNRYLYMALREDQDNEEQSQLIQQLQEMQSTIAKLQARSQMMIDDVKENTKVNQDIIKQMLQKQEESDYKTNAQVEGLKEHIQSFESQRVQEVKKIKHQIDNMQQAYLLQQKTTDKKLDQLLKLMGNKSTVI